MQPERHGPGDGRAPTRAHSPAPVRLSIIDHVNACVAEVLERARPDAERDGARPHPEDAPALYGWWADLEVTDENRQSVRAQVMYRQRLEHSILMGDHTAVRPHTCPACGCYSLHWDTARRRAVCTWDQCHDDDGLAHAWELAELANLHVTAGKKLKQSAT